MVSPPRRVRAAAGNRHMSPDLGCHPSVAPTPRRRRGAGIAGWIIPGATLILMPKCPMCVAMDVALLTGASISAASASHLRTAIVVLCGAVLFGLAVKALSIRRHNPASVDAEALVLGSQCSHCNQSPTQQCCRGAAIRDGRWRSGSGLDVENHRADHVAVVKIESNAIAGERRIESVSIPRVRRVQGNPCNGSGEAGKRILPKTGISHVSRKC